MVMISRTQVYMLTPQTQEQAGQPDNPKVQGALGHRVEQASSEQHAKSARAKCSTIRAGQSASAALPGCSTPQSCCQEALSSQCH